MIRAHLFVNDFLLTQLIDKDIDEIWSVKNPMGLLVEELKKRSGSQAKPVARLIWSNGMNNPTGAFIVGIYLNEKMLGKSGGESLEIAEEMAARDCLKRLYGTDEGGAPLPLGDRARKFSGLINEIFQRSFNNNANSKNDRKQRQQQIKN